MKTQESTRPRGPASICEPYRGFDLSTTRIVNTGPEIYEMLEATLEAGLVVATGQGVVTSVWAGPRGAIYLTVLERTLPVPLRMGESIVVAVTDVSEKGGARR